MNRQYEVLLMAYQASRIDVYNIKRLQVRVNRITVNYIPMALACDFTLPTLYSQSFFLYIGKKC